MAKAKDVRAALSDLKFELSVSNSLLIDLLQGGGSSSKGSEFERQICNQLSQWWTGDPTRGDVFWRTAGSGGRAYQRSKSNQTTEGQHGDIAATGDDGAALIRAFTIELKRGYDGSTMFDIFDKPAKFGGQEYEGFLSQAIDASRAAGTPWWMLITRRSSRLAWASMPMGAVELLRALGAFETRPIPSCHSLLSIAGEPYSVFSTTLENFLAAVTPDHIRKLQYVHFETDTSGCLDQ